MTDAEAHFSAEAHGEPAAPGRFVRIDDIAPVAFVEGLDFRAVLGEEALLSFATFAPHTEAPLHVHAEEQLTIVLTGELEFELDGHTRTMRPGDVAVIPPWVPHGARTRDTGCTEVDVFTPPRRSLLAFAEGAAADAAGEA